MSKLIIPALLAFLSTAVAGAASAAPIASGSTLISEDHGFDGVCDQPCYVATLEYEVWAPDDVDNPLALAGNNTYTYVISNLSDASSVVTIPAPGIPITEFEIVADFSAVTGAGFIDGSGINPTSTTVSALNVVSWGFPMSDQCPTCLVQGEMSDLLYIHSPLNPGDTGGSLTAIILDAGFTTVGPTEAVPEPGAAAVFVAGLAVIGRSLRRRH